jgi:hypothetical protein
MLLLLLLRDSFVFAYVGKTRRRKRADNQDGVAEGDYTKRIARHFCTGAVSHGRSEASLALSPGQKPGESQGIDFRKQWLQEPGLSFGWKHHWRCDLGNGKNKRGYEKS